MNNDSRFGRFLADRPIHFNTMKHKMSKFWHLACVSLSNKLNLIATTSSLNFPPTWSQEGSRAKSMVIWWPHARTGSSPTGPHPLTIPLKHIPLWVQVHDVPVGCVSVTAGKQLSNFVGDFMKMTKTISISSKLSCGYVCYLTSVNHR
jgi:hypothetical protein